MVHAPQAPPRTVDEWARRGSFQVVGGRRFFVVDTGGDKPPLLVLHGYPTSSHDYHEVLPKLAERHRVVIHDHLGFGLSDKPADYTYSLIAQADQALLVWRALGIREAHLFAHDYGTSIATELLARHNEGDRPVRLLSLTLSNGSTHIELAKLRLIQKLLRNRLLGPIVGRLSTQRIFRSNMRKLWADPAKLDDRDVRLMWALLTRDHGKRRLHQITQYLRDRVRYWHRWVGALEACDLPTHVLWGAEDPITGPNVARVHHAEIPHSTLTLLDGVGHYPMLESPTRWADALLRQVTGPEP